MVACMVMPAPLKGPSSRREIRHEKPRRRTTGFPPRPCGHEDDLRIGKRVVQVDRPAVNLMLLEQRSQPADDLACTHVISPNVIENVTQFLLIYHARLENEAGGGDIAQDRAQGLIDLMS